jgi:hypothetical protein
MFFAELLQIFNDGRSEFPIELPEQAGNLCGSQKVLGTVLVWSSHQARREFDVSDEGRRNDMQQGSVNRVHRKLGPDVWCFRWWESGPDGNRVHRKASEAQ